MTHGTRYVTYDEWCVMDEREQRQVKVINFTGLTDLTEHATLEKHPTADEAEGTLGVVREGE